MNNLFKIKKKNLNEKLYKIRKSKYIHDNHYSLLVNKLNIFTKND